MILNWNEYSNDTCKKSIMKIQYLKLVKSKNFRHIGLWISYEKINVGGKEIQHSISLRLE